MEGKVSITPRRRGHLQFNLRDLALVVLLTAIILLYLIPGGTDGVRQTGREMDVAILGRGYFQVHDGSGQKYYTRLGRLSVDADGRMYIGEGADRWWLEPAITLPQDWVTIEINKNGTLTYSDGTSIQMAIGEIRLARFANEEGLDQVFPNILAETFDSGPPLVGAPGNDGFGFLRQRWLEHSGVLIETPVLAVIGIILVVAGILLLEIRRLGRKLDVIMKQMPEQ